MKHLHLAALMGASLIAGVSSVTLAQAPETPAPAQTAPAAGEMRIVKIKNVPSALIAYQLDPDHNPRPAMFGPGELAGETERGILILPAGIEKLVSDDAQNLIIIRGEAEAMRRVADLIEILDQPMRQVEIEAQFVELAPAELRNFGIDFSETIEKAPRIGFVRNNFTARLNALVADNRAKLVAAPRVLTFNNLITPLDATSKQGADGEKMQNYRITPTINGDGTITVLFKDSDDPATGKAGLTTVINLRDGDIAALLGTTGVRPSDPARVVAVFFTPRIIRRANEPQK